MIGIGLSSASYRHPDVPQSRSGAFDGIDGGLASRRVGHNRLVTTNELFAEDCADLSEWTNLKNSIVSSGGKAVTGSTGICLAMPTTVVNRKNVRIDVKMELGGTSGSYYCAIPFRATRGTGANSDKFSGYCFRVTRAVTDTNKRTCGFYRVSATAGGDYPFDTEIINNVSGTVVWDDASQRAVTIIVQGYLLRAWISADATAPDITLPPTLVVYDHGESHPSGWVGFMALSASAGEEKFDDLSVKEIVHVAAAPPHVYAGRESTISVESEANVASARLTCPDGTIVGLRTPSDLVGAASGTVTFPDDFDLPEVPGAGGYLLDVRTASSRSVLAMELREKPLATFAVFSDTHISTAVNNYYSRLQEVIREINDETWFHKPHFAAHLGDIIEGAADMATPMALAKALMDTLDVPYFAIAGNHDTGNGEAWDDDGETFIATFGAVSWQTAKGPFAFGGISWTASDGGYYHSDDAAAIAYITALLAAYPSYRKVLFTHAPFQEVVPRSANTSSSLYEATANCNDMLDLMEADGGVIAHFSGHNHILARVAANGVHHFSVGSPANTRTWNYVELYADRMVVHRIQSLIWRGDYPDQIQSTSTDTLHATTVLYNHGLPNERTVAIWFADGSADIEPCIQTVHGYVDDATIQTDVTMTAEDQGCGECVAGLVFRRQDEQNYYAALLESGYDTGGRVYLQLVEDGVVTELATANLDIDTGSVYDLEVVLSGSSIIVNVGDVQQLSTTDSTWLAGGVGVKTHRGQPSFDAVVITP